MMKLKSDFLVVTYAGSEIERAFTVRPERPNTAK